MSGQTPNSRQTVYFRYRLKLNDRDEIEFNINLDSETLSIIPDEISYPEWARLGVHQCPNCSIDPELQEFCPPAANMARLMSFLGESVSFDRVDVLVETRHRSYQVVTTLQAVVSSIMGIYMVTSGCPVLDKMRPMVETHIPLYTGGETLYRAISMYLMAQYFRYRNGLEPHWDLQGLADYYKEVQNVNLSFAKRLRSISCTGDALINAITLLDSYGMLVKESILYDILDHWEKIFMSGWGIDPAK